MMVTHIDPRGRFARSLLVVLGAALMALSAAVLPVGGRRVAAAVPVLIQISAGHIVPGVRVESVDLSGLDEASARLRLDQAYAPFGQGAVSYTHLTLPTIYSV